MSWLEEDRASIKNNRQQVPVSSQIWKMIRPTASRDPREWRDSFLYTRRVSFRRLSMSEWQSNSGALVGSAKDENVESESIKMTPSQCSVPASLEVKQPNDSVTRCCERQEANRSKVEAYLGRSAVGRVMQMRPVAGKQCGRTNEKQ